MGGYMCFAHDHRGHGSTTAADARLGLFAASSGLTKVNQDIEFVNQHVRNKHAGLPIILLGHSMGAILALFHACQRQAEGIDAIALLNSGVDGGAVLAIYRGLLRAEALCRGRKAFSKVAQALTFSSWNRKFAPNRTPFDWLSRDSTEVDKYIADPLCGVPASNSLWFDVTDAIRFCATDTSLERLPEGLPVYLLGGGADPCTAQGQAMKRLARRMESMAMSDVTCQVLPETRHESLNELSRDQTTAAFTRWLDERFR